MSVEKTVTPRVKICGITNIKDAMMAAYMGADAVGFILVPDTKRYINAEIAKNIVKHMPLFVNTVAVFMNQSKDEVNQIAEVIQPDYIQLHGDEPPDYCDSIRSNIIKRVNIEDCDTPETLCKKMLQYQVAGFLLDPGAGTGQVFDWSCTIGLEMPFILAGGLTPDNVKQAVHIVQPYAVDVSSGVEETSGKKDPEKVRRFIMEAKA